MQKQLDGKHLAAMAGALDNDELGAAVRLLSRIMSSGKPVAAKRGRIISQMTPERWDESEGAILEHFNVEADLISHDILDERQLPPVSMPARAAPGRTGEMPIVHPTRDITVPTYSSREMPERVSIKKAAFDTAIEIFQRSEMSANTARAVIASLLKNWPAGDVYEAISAADRQGFLADPRSWIVAQLQHNSTPIVSSRTRRDATPPPARRKPRKIVTPQAVGVSQSTADHIRERNASLKLNLDLDDVKSS